jgi:hypothetical protein
MGIDLLAGCGDCNTRGVGAGGARPAGATMEDRKIEDDQDDPSSIFHLYRRPALELDARAAAPND